MKRVLFVVNHLNGGGIEQVLLDLSDILRSSYKISVLSIYDINSIYKEHLADLVSYDTLDIFRFKFNNRILKSLYSRIFDYKWVQRILLNIYLLFHFHETVIAFSDGLSVQLVSSCLFKNKKIAWLHTDFFDDSRINRRALSGIIKEYRKFNMVIAVSENLKQKYVNIINENNIQCIYNPLNPKRFIKKSSVNKLENNIFNIISVGRLSWEKGFDRLIKSIYGIPLEVRHKFHLTIIGDGSERKKLENMIQTLGLSDTVTLVGFVENPFWYYGAADLLLLPSRFEGFGLVLLEAMVYNIPIIATETAGTKEVLGNGDFGLLLPNSDHAFDNIIEYAVENIGEMKKFVEKYPAALANYDPQKIILKLKTVL